MAKQQSKPTTSTNTTKSRSAKQSVSSQSKRDSASTHSHHLSTSGSETSSLPSVSPTQRLHMIEEAAYYLAEQRGFLPGLETEDWLAAESTIDETLPQQGR